jgi:hypothetical protein
VKNELVSHYKDQGYSDAQAARIADWLTKPAAAQTSGERSSALRAPKREYRPVPTPEFIGVTTVNPPAEATEHDYTPGPFGRCTVCRRQKKSHELEDQPPTVNNTNKRKGRK